MPGFTLNRDGAIIQDEPIITQLKEYRETLEFNNAGGARKLAHYLAVEQRIYINHKKIYWGKDCSTYAERLQKNCTEGNIWMSRQDLLRSAGGLQVFLPK